MLEFPISIIHLRCIREVFSNVLSSLPISGYFCILSAPTVTPAWLWKSQSASVIATCYARASTKAKKKINKKPDFSRSYRHLSFSKQPMKTGHSTLLCYIIPSLPHVFISGWYCTYELLVKYVYRNKMRIELIHRYTYICIQTYIVLQPNVKEKLRLPPNLRQDKQKKTQLYMLTGGACGVMGIVIGIGHDDTSSNPGRDWLHFT